MNATESRASVTLAGWLLHMWEQAGGLASIERALVLATDPDDDPPLTALPVGYLNRPVGQLNQRLLLLRDRLFGPILEIAVSCSECNRMNEFEMSTRVLTDVKPAEVVSVMIHGEYAVEWRSPTPADLLAVADATDPSEALRERCLRVTGPDGRERSHRELSREAWAAVDTLLAEADPLAEIRVDVICSECSADFATSLDPGLFLWAEIDAHARRTLAEIDVLARAYGWTEPEVLALSEARRAAYLRLVLDGGV